MKTCSDPSDLGTLLPRIAARARRLSRDADSAQDLAQETVLRLCLKLRSDTKVDNLEAYAMVTLRNLAATRWRAFRPTEALQDTQAVCQPDAPRRLAVQDLMTAVDKLPEDQATLMRLVAAGETSPATLAKQLGLPPGTVMSRLSRARQSLRDDFDLAAGASVSDLI